MSTQPPSIDRTKLDRFIERVEAFSNRIRKQKTEESQVSDGDLNDREEVLRLDARDQPLYARLVDFTVLLNRMRQGNTPSLESTVNPSNLTIQERLIEGIESLLPKTEPTDSYLKELVFDSIGVVLDYVRQVRSKLPSTPSASTSVTHEADQWDALLVTISTSIRRHLDDTLELDQQGRPAAEQAYRTLIGASLFPSMVALLCPTGNKLTGTGHGPSKVDMIISPIAGVEIANVLSELLANKHRKNREALRSQLPAAQIALIMRDSLSSHLSIALFDIAFRMLPTAVNARDQWMQELFPSSIYHERTEQIVELFRACTTGADDYYATRDQLLTLMAHRSFEGAQPFRIQTLALNDQILIEPDAEALFWISHDFLEAVVASREELLGGQAQEDVDKERKLYASLDSIKEIVIDDKIEPGMFVIIFKLNRAPVIISISASLEGPDEIEDSQQIVIRISAKQSQVLNRLKSTFERRSTRYARFAVKFHPLLEELEQSTVPSKSMGTKSRVSHAPPIEAPVSHGESFDPINEEASLEQTVDPSCDQTEEIDSFTTRGDSQLRASQVRKMADLESPVAEEGKEEETDGPEDLRSESGPKILVEASLEPEPEPMQGKTTTISGEVNAHEKNDELTSRQVDISPELYGSAGPQKLDRGDVSIRNGDRASTKSRSSNQFSVNTRASDQNGINKHVEASASAGRVLRTRAPRVSETSLKPATASTAAARKKPPSSDLSSPLTSDQGGKQRRGQPVRVDSNLVRTMSRKRARDDTSEEDTDADDEDEGEDQASSPESFGQHETLSPPRESKPTPRKRYGHQKKQRQMVEKQERSVKRVPAQASARTRGKPMTPKEPADGMGTSSSAEEGRSDRAHTTTSRSTRAKKPVVRSMKTKHGSESKKESTSMTATSKNSRFTTTQKKSGPQEHKTASPSKRGRGKGSKYVRSAAGTFEEPSDRSEAESGGEVTDYDEPGLTATTTKAPARKKKKKTLEDFKLASPGASTKRKRVPAKVKSKVEPPRKKVQQDEEATSTLPMKTKPIHVPLPAAAPSSRSPSLPAKHAQSTTPAQTRAGVATPQKMKRATVSHRRDAASPSRQLRSSSAAPRAFGSNTNYKSHTAGYATPQRIDAAEDDAHGEGGDMGGIEHDFDWGGDTSKDGNDQDQSRFPTTPEPIAALSRAKNLTSEVDGERESSTESMMVNPEQDEDFVVKALDAQVADAPKSLPPKMTDKEITGSIDDQVPGSTLGGDSQEGVGEEEEGLSELVQPSPSPLRLGEHILGKTPEQECFVHAEQHRSATAVEDTEMPMEDLTKRSHKEKDQIEPDIDTESIHGHTVHFALSGEPEEDGGEVDGGEVEMAPPVTVAPLPLQSRSRPRQAQASVYRPALAPLPPLPPILMQQKTFSFDHAGPAQEYFRQRALGTTPRRQRKSIPQVASSRRKQPRASHTLAQPPPPLPAKSDTLGPRSTASSAPIESSSPEPLRRGESSHTNSRARQVPRAGQTKRKPVEPPVEPSGILRVVEEQLSDCYDIMFKNHQVRHQAQLDQLAQGRQRVQAAAFQSARYITKQTSKITDVVGHWAKGSEAQSARFHERMQNLIEESLRLFAEGEK